MTEIMDTMGKAPGENRAELERIFKRELLPLLVNVYNFALYLCRDKQDADDLTQETYEKAFRALDHYQRDTNAKAWMFKIMKNAFINRYRKQVRQPGLVSIDDVFSLHEKSEAHAAGQFSPQEDRIEQGLGDEVTTAVNSLDTPYRIVIILSDIEDFTYEEIAAILNVPIGTVRSRLHRARQMLKEKLKTYSSHMGYGE